MAYSDIPAEELILMAAEFVGRGLEIPQEIARTLGPGLTSDIQFPEATHDRHPSGELSTHQ